MDNKKKIIIKLVKDIQMILVHDERIPMSAAKEINKNLVAILNALK